MKFTGGELEGISSAELLMVGRRRALTGTVEYVHDEQGARVTVDYELP